MGVSPGQKKNDRNEVAVLRRRVVGGVPMYLILQYIAGSLDQNMHSNQKND